MPFFWFNWLANLLLGKYIPHSDFLIFTSWYNFGSIWRYIDWFKITFMALEWLSNLSSWLNIPQPYSFIITGWNYFLSIWSKLYWFYIRFVTFKWFQVITLKVIENNGFIFTCWSCHLIIVWDTDTVNLIIMIMEHFLFNFKW